MSIHRERRRVGRAFRAALLAVGSPTLVIACTSSIPSLPDRTTGSPPADAATDGFTDAAVTQTDDGGPSDAARDGATAARDGRAGDAGDAEGSAPPPEAGEAGPVTGTGGCFQRAFELDGGPGADAAADLCGYVYGCGLEGTGLKAVGCQVLQELADGATAPIPQMSCSLEEGQGCDQDVYAPGEGGLLTILCTCPTAAGRRPAGLRKPRRARAPTPLGTYLRSMAFEEGASIVAFERMGKELASLGAPEWLVAEAARAASDEARHVRAMEGLAQREARSTARPYRAVPCERARMRGAPPRTAAAIAAENAAEGCVRETYGALVAQWQSLHAQDAAVKRAFARIAVDEARHAALSWTVAGWVGDRLDAAGQRHVARSQSRALGRLRRAAQIEPPRELARSVGLPSAHEASVLLDVLGRELGLARSAVSRVARR